MSLERIKIDNLKEWPKIKQEIIGYLFEQLSRKPYDNWYSYKGKFEYEGKRYDLECECKLDRQVFSFRNLHIAHETQIIDVDQLVRDGFNA